MDLLSHSECEQILANKCKDDVQLEHFEVQPAKDVIGFLGEYYRLVLHCSVPTTVACGRNDGNNKIKYNFFIKAINRKIAEPENVFIFKKEVDLYTTLLKQLQTYTTTLICPKSYYARSDLLVLEDLNTLGYEKFRSAGGSLNEDELKASLRVLAALHAASITHEWHTGCGINTQYPAELFHEITVSPHIAWYSTGLSGILALAKLHPAYQSPQQQNFIENELEPRLAALVSVLQQPSQQYRNVVCHRDPWLANLLFDYNGMNAVLVDYQTCRYCPPSVDVIFVIFMNLDSDTRKLGEKMYLHYYYKQLRNELAHHKLMVEEQLPISEFLKSYEDLKLFGFLYRAIALTLLAVPAEFVTNEYRFIDRRKQLVEYMETSERFRATMENCIGDLLEFVVNKKS